MVGVDLPAHGHFLGVARAARRHHGDVVEGVRAPGPLATSDLDLVHACSLTGPSRREAHHVPVVISVSNQKTGRCPASGAPAVAHPLPGAPPKGHTPMARPPALATGILAICLTTAAATGVAASAPASTPLPSTLTDAVDALTTTLDTRAVTKPVVPTAATSKAASALLSSSGKGARASWDPRFGTLRSLRGPAPLTGAREGSAVEVARGWLREHAAAFGLSTRRRSTRSRSSATTPSRAPAPTRSTSSRRPPGSQRSAGPAQRRRHQGRRDPLVCR